jgi:transketolase
MYSKISKEIRKTLLEITSLKKAAHIASNLSIVDILVVLYKDFVKKNNKNQFILSKGHACLSVYCILSYFKYFSKSLLKSFGDNNTVMMCHISHKVPGIKISTGSLGHGLPIAAGKAFANRKIQIFVLLSDGELNEGSNWEAFLFIAHHNLKNIKIIIDSNKIQSIDFVKNVINMEPMSEKFRSFGFSVSSINGHSHKQIYQSLNKKDSKPRIIIANTTKGKGVGFMENSVLWHYKPPNKEELELAIKKL